MLRYKLPFIKAWQAVKLELTRAKLTFNIDRNFNQSQGWKLRELMATFYQLKHQAELVGRCGMHITSNPLQDMLKDEKQAKHINEVQIPAIAAEITKILNEEK